MAWTFPLESTTAAKRRWASSSVACTATSVELSSPRPVPSVDTLYHSVSNALRLASYFTETNRWLPSASTDAVVVRRTIRSSGSEPPAGKIAPAENPPLVPFPGIEAGPRLGALGVPAHTIGPSSWSPIVNRPALALDGPARQRTGLPFVIRALSSVEVASRHANGRLGGVPAQRAVAVEGGFTVVANTVSTVEPESDDNVSQIPDRPVVDSRIEREDGTLRSPGDAVVRAEEDDGRPVSKRHPVVTV